MHDAVLYAQHEAVVRAGQIDQRHDDKRAVLLAGVDQHVNCFFVFGREVAAGVWVDVNISVNVDVINVSIYFNVNVKVDVNVNVNFHVNVNVYYIRCYG